MEFNNPRAGLICVGSELLRGKINTHASTLARRLASAGIDLAHEQTLGDVLEELTRSIREGLNRYPIVIVTGGLGPTFDDLTREAAAAAVHRRLLFSATLLRGIQIKFKRSRLPSMPPANARQAYVIDGAQPIPNAVGTAPGQWLELTRRGGALSPPEISGQARRPAPTRVLILLPGPPSELEPMLESFVLPKLKKTFPAMPRVEAHLHFVGVPESVVDYRLRPLIDEEKGAQFTILAHLGLVDFDIFMSDSSRSRAHKRLSRLVSSVRRKMGEAFYGMDEDYPLERVVMKRFIDHQATLAVAESCTGGMLSERLTEAAGSSAYFYGGVVSYANDVKVSSLDVPEKTLSTFGAVSKETASAMAEGVRERCRSTWGLGITGLAGPGGASKGKPVGLVFIGISGPKGTKTYEYHFRGSRDAIRQRAVIVALDLLRLIYL